MEECIYAEFTCIREEGRHALTVSEKGEVGGVCGGGNDQRGVFA